MENLIKKSARSKFSKEETEVMIEFFSSSQLIKISVEWGGFFNGDWRTLKLLNLTY